MKKTLTWWGEVVHCVTKGHMVDEHNIVLEHEVLGQGMFVNQYTHSLDPKKRLTIPSGWRAQVGQPRSLYVLRDVHQKCLCVYPAAAMMKRLEKMRQHSIADAKARHFARVLGSQSDLVSWDSQGRIRIKDDLLDFAGLKDRVSLVGSIDMFELWSPENLEMLTDMGGDSLQDAAKYVGF
ncbi:MAG: hypothetical protein KAH23_03400 [Kiritimatiellae bacterium]|nr:hypothetical protein [Kiritimatiellia bacterium]